MLSACRWLLASLTLLWPQPAIWRLIDTLGVKIISVQVESSNLLTLTQVIELQFRIILEVCACLARGYMGVKTESKKVWPIYFLCKIGISKFVTCL